MLGALRSFLPSSSPRSTACAVLRRLEEIEAALRSSDLFWSVEIIGSSLFFAADAHGNCGVWMLDFGLTAPSPVGPLRHDVPWQRGNHEDGYLLGLTNMQALWRRLIDEL